MPAQQGVGGDDQVEPAKPRPGQAVQQRGEYGPVGPGQLWLAGLTLQYGELVAECEDLQTLRPISHGQQAYEAEEGRHGEVEQS